MISAEQFLDALALDGAVDRDVLDGMRQEIGSRGDSITAQALATRLVAMGAISNDTADRLLLPASDSFIQVGADALATSPSASSSSASSSRINPAPPPSFEDPEDLYGDNQGPSKPDKKRRRHVKKGASNEFDSPLLLIGGGGLVLLVLCGVGLALLLTQRSGDEVLDAARTAYESGSYAAATKAYEEFVEDFPTHGRWSEARVALAATRLRQSVESGRDWPAALSIAQTEVRAVEDEPAFADNRAEFAALLPRVALGLAGRAESLSESLSGGGDDAEVGRLAGLADEALTLAVNTKYAPKSLQDPTQATMVRELLARVERRRASATDLSAAIASIRAATQRGDPGASYRVHRDLLAARPELREEPSLDEALTQAAEAERDAIRFAPSPLEAATDPRASPIVASIALATPLRAGTASASGVFAAQVGETLYGVSERNGDLLWRRPIGESLARSTAQAIDDDLLVVDQRHGELLRLRAESGEVVWRTTLGEEPPAGGFYSPRAVADRVLVASSAGELWSIDAGTGRRLGATRFAQPLASAPVAGPEGRRLHLVGRQSVVYTLDAESLDAVAVSYTGHSAEACPVSPVIIPGGLVLAENVGVATSRLRVYPIGDDGLATADASELRLEGVIDAPLVVQGSRLLVGARSGAATLLEIAPSNEGNPLELVASAPGASSDIGALFTMRGAEVWIASRGLQRTAASLADSQLVAATVRDPCSGDAFFGTLEARDRVVLHTRLRRGRPGATVAATNARSGAILWETVLATPPITPPRPVREPRGLLAVDRTGVAHLLGRSQITRGVSSSPAAPTARGPRIAHAVNLSGDLSLLTSIDSSEALSLTAGEAATSVSLPGRPACRPTALGRVALAPLAVGQVALIGSDGSMVGAPFMPPVAVGDEVAWTPAAVGRIGDATLAVLTDGVETAYCLEIRGGASPAVTLREERPITGATPVGPAAIAAGHAVVGLSGGRAAIFPLPSFGSPQVIELGSQAEIGWGPYAVGDRFLAWLPDAGLVAVDPTSAKVAWGATTAEPIGEPLVEEDGITVATAAGLVERFALASGERLGLIELGQRLGSGPTAYGKRLLLSAEDGTALVTGRP